MTWALIVHGGAKDIEPEEESANRQGCIAAVEAGRAILEQGGSAVDAVEAAVRALENDPTFNAGYGSALKEDGGVEMCSGLMDGATLDVGGVAVIKGVRNPVSVAKLMLRDEPVLIAGDGARQYAEKKGAELCDPDDLIPPEMKEEARRSGTHDTVGAVALDTTGNVAAATSTGGLDGAPVGRIGDSPQPGCGYYADNYVGAVAFSGDGEEIARVMLAARVMHLMPKQVPQDALEVVLPKVAELEAEAGGIAIARDGQIGWAHNSREFAVAYQTSDMEAPRAYIRKTEDEQ